MVEIALPRASVFERRLDEARREAGYSFRDLAQLTEVTASMMNRLPKDRTDCSASTIRARVASVLRQSLEQLFAFACYPSPSVDGLLGTDSGHCEAAVATTRNVINEQTVRKGAA